ncbi:thiazolylpeptide-type bacteriocin [Kitasatospora sp. NPDC127111]|uniref:thiazolylpeptide-type bacteriocin n=1 Tax=Kitasatospora sp. NPDC127111 TaxID=3345363 RepID=UPI0036371D2A
MSESVNTPQADEQAQAPAVDVEELSVLEVGDAAALPEMGASSGGWACCSSSSSTCCC